MKRKICLKITLYADTHAYVRIMKPIDTAELDEEGIKNVHAIVEKEIREAFAELPGPYGRA